MAYGVPTQTGGVSLTQGDQPALAGLSIEAMPVVELTGSSASAIQTGDVQVRNSAGVVLATFKGESAGRRKPGCAAR